MINTLDNQYGAWPQATLSRISNQGGSKTRLEIDLETMTATLKAQNLSMAFYRRHGGGFIPAGWKTLEFLRNEHLKDACFWMDLAIAPNVARTKLS